MEAVLGQGKSRQEGRGVRDACNSDQGCSEEGIRADRAKWEEHEGGIHRTCGGGVEAAGECIKGGEVLLQCLDTGAAVYLHQGTRGNGAGKFEASGPAGDTAEGIICLRLFRDNTGVGEKGAAAQLAVCIQGKERDRRTTATVEPYERQSLPEEGGSGKGARGPEACI